MAGRVVVVTGGTAGVGRATVRAFAAAGDDVAVIARGEDGLKAAVAEVEAAGRRGLAVPCDVADAAAVEAAAEQVERELGPIDVWVNNVMTAVFARFWDVTPEDYRRVTEVTYLGYVNGMRSALTRFRARGAGHVIQVGSALAYRGIPLQSAYCGAKHAINGFTESVRAELIAERSPVRITDIHLAAMNTPQFRIVRSAMSRKPQPVAPIYQPEVAARAVLWAADHPGRREIWVGAPTVYTILGSRLASWVADHYLGRTGISGQLTDEPADPDAPDNLYSPVPGDHGAHGDFDDRAWGRSAQLELALRRPVVLGAAAVAGVTAAALARRR
jgi:NAD(P)-dependent dehydrogenase (short-subunit alcohol dehydrogenase family)